MDYNSQDVGKQTADQMGNIGKNAGKKVVKKLARKVGKILKKLLMQLIKRIIMSLLKAILTFIGPWGCLAIIVVIIFLGVLSAIPGADWFMHGGKRTQAQMQSDQAYEQKFKDLSNASVTPIEKEDANTSWKKTLEDEIKPSWGIPASLAEYEIMNANYKISYPDVNTLFKGLQPSFYYKTVNDNKQTIKTTTSCNGTKTSTTTSTSFTVSTKKTVKDCTKQIVYTKVVMPDGKIQFISRTETVCKVNPKLTKTTTKKVTNNPNLPVVPQYKTISSTKRNTSNGYEQTTIQEGEIVNNKTQQQTQDVSNTSETTKTTNLPKTKILSKIVTIYGDVVIPSIKRYYPGPTTSFRPNAWEKTKQTQQKNGNEICTVTTYRQYQKTTVDDSTVPMISSEPSKLQNFLLSKGVKNSDINLVHQFIATFDSNFNTQVLGGAGGGGNIGAGLTLSGGGGSAPFIIAQFIPEAQQLQDQTGIPASVTLAQITLESQSHGHLSGLATEGKNLFGIKGVGPAGSVNMLTREVYGGVSVYITAPFRAYHNYLECMIDHARVISTPRYARYFVTAKNPVDYAVDLQRAGYATDPFYAQKLVSIINADGLHQYDTNNYTFTPIN